MNMDEKTREDLDRYVELTEWIHELSAPQVPGIRDGGEYRDRFARGYVRIRELARNSKAILKTHIFPILEKRGPLTGEERETLCYLSDHLLDAVRIESVDVPLRTRMLDRLLADAEAQNDTAMVLKALDGIVECCYYTMIVAANFFETADFFSPFQKRGMEAFQRILSYLDKDRFAALDYASKEIVLVNTRYINAMYEFAIPPVSEENNRAHLEALKRAIALADDPFYIAQASKYNWKYHMYRALQGIAHITEYHNACGASREILKEVCACTRQMLALWKEEKVLFGALSAPEVMYMNMYRNAYLAGETTLPAYRRQVMELIDGADKEDFSHDGNMNLIFAQTEYMMTLDRAHLTNEQTETVQRFYKNLIIYVHRMPKVGSFTFLINYLSHAIDVFVETDGGLTFEELAEELLAGINPQIYSHSLNTAAIAAFLTRRLFEKNQEILKDIPGYPDADRVTDFVYRAARLHDIGKIKIADTIIAYQREWFPAEYDAVAATPGIAAQMLARFESTKRYANTVLAHHVFFDGSGGYPAGVDTGAIPEIAAAHIIGFANDMEGATDPVRFDDVRGLTVREFLEQAEPGSGTRYAPYLTELFDDGETEEALTNMLETETRNTYNRTYELLVERLRGQVAGR